MAWSEGKLAAGESPALIANLDARCLWLLPEEAAAIDFEVFEDMLADLKHDIGDNE